MVFETDATPPVSGKLLVHISEYGITGRLIKLLTANTLLSLMRLQIKDAFKLAADRELTQLID